MPKRTGEGIALLADPVRRRLIASIALGPRRPSKLAEEVGLSRPAVSRHLGLLIEAGLVRVRRSHADRRVYLYGIEPDRHGQITAWLAGTEIARPSPLLDRPPMRAPGPPAVDWLDRTDDEDDDDPSV